MDALFRADDEADMIPFADGLGGVENLAGRRINRWLIERVKPAATNRVSGFGIVLQLKFRAGRPHRAAVIRDVKNDAAVAAFRNVVIQLQFERAELVRGDDVAGVMRIHADERTVLRSEEHTSE